MMRRGPLADTPIDALLADAATERTNGVLELHASVDGLVYLVDGEIYLAELADQPALDERLIAAGLLTQAQVDEHGVVSDGGVHLARALDTDPTIDEDAIDAYLLDVTAATLARFVGATEGEYELDPYGAHPAGVMCSWMPDMVLGRVEELREEAAQLEAERLEEERLAAEAAKAERLAAEAAEAERLAAVRAEAERVAAARAEAERVASEAAEAEREAAEQAEAAAGAAAEQVDAPLADAADQAAKPVAAATEGAATDDTSGEPISSEPTGDLPVAAAPKNAPSADALTANTVPLGDRRPGGLGDLAPGVLVVVPDEPPPGTEKIELETIEWKVVVLAAQGDALGAIASRLDLSLEEARSVVENLWCRGLLATIGPGGPVAV